MNLSYFWLREKPRTITIKNNLPSKVTHMSCDNPYMFTALFASPSEQQSGDEIIRSSVKLVERKFLLLAMIGFLMKFRL